MHHEHCSLLTSTDHICACGPIHTDFSVILVCSKESVIWSAMSSPCWSLPHLLSSSPPQHEAPLGQHDLLQDDTVHTEHLFQNLYSRQSALMNCSRTSITRVAETCATPPTKNGSICEISFLWCHRERKTCHASDIAVQWGGKHMFQQAPRTSVSKENYREYVYLSKSGPKCEA